MDVLSRVAELRSSRAAALGAPLLADLRELTLVEMGTLEALLLAHGLLPEVQLRDALLALALLTNSSCYTQPKPSIGLVCNLDVNNISVAHRFCCVLLGTLPNLDLSM